MDNFVVIAAIVTGGSALAWIPVLASKAGTYFRQIRAEARDSGLYTWRHSSKLTF
jgi:hypothetical protein